MNEYGVSFAPTRDNAALGPRQGQLTGVPQAVQVLSLALPRVVGARPVAPPDLLTAKGGEGIDPIASAILQTMLRTMRGQPPLGQPGSLPGGTAGPNIPDVPTPRPGPGRGGGGREGGPFPQQGPDPMLPTMPSLPGKPPRVRPEDGDEPGNGGGWTPGAGPFTPRPPRGFGR